MRRRVIALARLLCIAQVFIATTAIMAQEVVRVSDLGITADAPFYIAAEKGHFKERGIQVKTEQFASAATAMAPLSTGELHVVGGGINPGLFNSFARGWPVHVVGPRARDLPGNSDNALMVRSDLRDQVRNFGDLKGKKIAINAPGSPLTYMLGKMLESESLSLKDVDVVYMPWPDMASAFVNKAIHAGTIVEPFIVQYEERGLAYVFKRPSDVIRNPWFEVSVLLFNSDWAKKNPRLAGDFMVAYLKGARDFYDATYGGETRRQVIEILVKRTRVKDKALYDRMQWAYVDPNGIVLKESLRDQQDWYAKQGLVPKKVDIAEIVDERYAKYALEQLGLHRARVGPR